jgi:hypothetical protein
VPVAAEFDDYASEVGGGCAPCDVRAEVDVSDDTLGKKIREAQTSKIPYTLSSGATSATPAPSRCGPTGASSARTSRSTPSSTEIAAEIATASAARGGARVSRTRAAGVPEDGRSRRRGPRDARATSPASAVEDLQRLWAPWRFGYVARRRPRRGAARSACCPPAGPSATASR